MIDIRDSFNLPGMRIFQFGFGSPQDPFLPHHYLCNCVAYTGTHDNDTVLGWYRTASKKEQRLARKYLNSTTYKLPWMMIRVLWASVANFVLAPMQDLLGLGPEARMNFPGREAGNWGWRMTEAALSDTLQKNLLEPCSTCGGGQSQSDHDAADLTSDVCAARRVRGDFTSVDQSGMARMHHSPDSIITYTSTTSVLHSFPTSKCDLVAGGSCAWVD